MIAMSPQIPGPRDEARMGEHLKEFRPALMTRVKSILSPGALLQQAIILVESLFVDVSFWQKFINFVKMRSAGALGAIVRAGQNSWVDAMWFQNWRNAKAAGLPRGSYWFYDSRYDPKKQAQLWASVIKLDTGEMEHVLDLEENYGGPFKGWRHWYDCLVEFQRLTNLPNDRIGIYTGYFYWLENGPNPMTEADSLAWFKRFPLWLAYWTADPANVRIPAPWTEVRHWQKGPMPEGERYGVETAEIDINYANMHALDFVAKYGGAAPEPPPDGGEMSYGTAQEMLGKTGTIRTTPAVESGNDTGKRIAPYTITQFIEVVDGKLVPADKWLKLPDGNFLNYILAGRRYFQILTQPSSVPDPEPPPAAMVARIEMTLTSGSIVTLKDEAGNVLETITA